MGPSAGARLYSAAVHVLALVGVASLVAFGLHFARPASGGTAAGAHRDVAAATVRQVPSQALAMISAPMRSHAPAAVQPEHARGDGGRWRVSYKTADTVVAARAESDAPLLRLDPVDQVLNASTEKARSVAPDAVTLQHGDDSGAGVGEGRGARRLVAAQAANAPETAEDAARPLLVLADAPVAQADQPLLPNFSDAGAAPAPERSVDQPAVASDAPEHDQGQGDSRDTGAAGPAGGDNPGDLAAPDPGVKDGGAQ